MHDAPPPPPAPPTLPDVVRDVARDFVGFARAWLAGGVRPAFFFVVWIVGMDTLVAAVEMESLTGQWTTADWFHTWLRVIFAGLFMGWVRYALGGSAYWLGIRLAGGRASLRAAWDVFAYAMLPTAVIDLGVKVIQMFVYGNAYFAGRRDAFVEGILGAAMFVGALLAMKLCWQGMTGLFGAPRGRSAAVIALTLVALFALTLAATLLGAGGGG